MFKSLKRGSGDSPAGSGTGNGLPADPTDPNYKGASGASQAKLTIDSSGVHAGGAEGAGAASGAGTIFTGPVPGGAQKTMANMLGEIVWLMSQSPAHKQFFISDLEWFVMTPLLLKQFRVFYATDRPLGVVLWGLVNDEVQERLKSGSARLKPQDWNSGDKLWVVEVISPFGGAEEMVKDLKAKVFPDKPVNFVSASKDGKREVRILE